MNITDLIKILFASLFVTGCGMIDRGCAKYTGAPSEVCHDGVVYLQFTSGTAVKVNTAGVPVGC